MSGVAPKPFLKWAGGKTWMLEHLDGAMPVCWGRHFEPFLGGGAFALHRLHTRRATRAVLSDTSRPLMITWLSVQRRPEDVAKELERLPLVLQKRQYEELRLEHNMRTPNAEFRVDPVYAARMIWLNHACFNGLWRENRKGWMNTPVGSYKKVSLPTPEELFAVAYAIRDAELQVSDFREVMRTAGESGDHVYCDPPYVPLSDTAHFTAYGDCWDGDASQRLLAEEARRASKKDVLVVLTNHRTPYVETELYPSPPFRHVVVEKAGRSISASAKGRAKVEELIVSIGGPADTSA